MLEQGRDVGEPVEASSQCRFEHWLREGVSPGKAVFARGRLHRGEALAGGVDVIRAVIKRDILDDLAGEADGLHGSQGFVVNGNGARFAHGRRIAFNQDNAPTRPAQNIGERQTGRTGADDDNVGGHRAHAATPGLGSARERDATNASQPPASAPPRAEHANEQGNSGRAHANRANFGPRDYLIERAAEAATTGKRGLASPRTAYPARYNSFRTSAAR